MKRIYFILLIILSLVIGCATYVDISYERYMPRFQVDKYSAYEGKKLFLSSFTNNANNTSIFYYFSPDFKIKYGEYAIASYYWYCFDKAFHNVGMIIYQDTAPSNIPEFLFEFDYLTDKKISFIVTVNKNLKVVYKKKFDMTMPGTESNNISYLENRAYEMVDSIITSILNDPDFSAVL